MQKLLTFFCILILLSCEGESVLDVEILLQVKSPEFVEGCTIPITIKVQDGNKSIEELNLFIDDSAVGEVEPNPSVYYWDTDGYAAGGYRIRVSLTTNDQHTVSHEITITLQPVCVSCPDEVTDYDGNRYPVVRIGNQCWMAENLRSTHSANGTPLKYGNGIQTDSLSSTFVPPYDDAVGWYFSYRGDTAYSTQYGYLYPWYTVVYGTELQRNTDGFIQGIAPEGWHIPEVEEWQALIDFLGGVEVAGQRLKDLDSPLWEQSFPENPDASGFAALPGGCNLFNNSYLGEGESSYFWSATPTIVNHAYHILLSDYDSRANVLGHQDSKRFGYSVRCVMNSAN